MSLLHTVFECRKTRTDHNTTTCSSPYTVRLVTRSQPKKNFIKQALACIEPSPDRHQLSATCKFVYPNIIIASLMATSRLQGYISALSFRIQESAYLPSSHRPIQAGKLMKAGVSVDWVIACSSVLFINILRQL